MCGFLCFYFLPLWFPDLIVVWLSSVFCCDPAPVCRLPQPASSLQSFCDSYPSLLKFPFPCCPSVSSRASTRICLIGLYGKRQNKSKELWQAFEDGLPKLLVGYLQKQSAVRGCFPRDLYVQRSLHGNQEHRSPAAMSEAIQQT